MKKKLKNDFKKRIIPSLIGGLILWSMLHLIVDFIEK
tara:strand:- start:853 stop:963 length:111 start_codon:yes stop_codon:yes gene_type:complete